MKRCTVIVLCLIGVSLVTAGVVGLWAQTAVVDERGFSAAAVETMRTPAVSQFMAASLLDVVEERFNLNGLWDRSRAEELFAEVLRRPSSVPFLGSIAAAFHRSLFVAGAGGVQLSFAEGASVIEEGLSEVDPSLMQLLPSPAEWGETLILTREEIPRLSATVGLLPWAAAVSVVVGILLVVCGVSIAERRSQALTTVGLGLAGWGAVLVAAVVVSSRLVGGFVEDPLLREVVASGLGEVTGGLFWVGAVIFIGGIAMMTYAGRRARRPAPAHSRPSTSRRP